MPAQKIFEPVSSAPRGHRPVIPFLVSEIRQNLPSPVGNDSPNSGNTPIRINTLQPEMLRYSGSTSKFDGENKVKTLVRESIISANLSM